ncbi:RNA polymerase sigma factor [Fibrella sp. HMF5335]|uniref:RNA polymerase sigma factor n=1 Tax=Fibrella rubiginis TaxID=2817060 RepID=A0A939GIC5_9BACT|nr:RNA polymerase sigma factor [Fibrella rubiginis]MBO0937296.1 RNA polymerase sigma factor [Fibrella rubiginis]
MSRRTSPFIEADLVARLLQRDERAFLWLYQHYSLSLGRAIQLLVHNEEQTRDLLQDVFVKIWTNLGRYDAGKGRLYTWMLNVARNTALDALRSGKAKKRVDATQMLFFTENTIQIIDQQCHTNAINIDTIGLRTLLTKLPPSHSQLIDLIYLNGYTQQEAADELKIPVGTVKTRLQATLQELRRAM